MNINHGRLLLLIGLMLMQGCDSSSVLYNNLPENEANEMIAILNKNGVQANKVINKQGVSVTVNARDFTSAISELNKQGYPKNIKENLGEVFSKDTMLSSPLEEKARYIYALSQEMESTLEQIDGVISARVHIVLAERIAPGDPVQPASAAVFIKHRDYLDPDIYENKIKELIITGLPGLMRNASTDTSVIFVNENSRDNAQEGLSEVKNSEVFSFIRKILTLLIFLCGSGWLVWKIINGKFKRR
ncbi:type III secretion system inner membrane ring lipoprotein SctJ [Cedecea sp.]|uniref:type III secretion system inner membrane ring lipoprotein SctJ n=1 Tax=Cedecea sp. TaxID=1970739 RepID=UPI002F4194FF